MVVEADGGPLGVVFDAANVHDAKLLKRTPQAIVVPKPRPTPRQKQHLCLDKGYDNPTGHAVGIRRTFAVSARRNWTLVAGSDIRLVAGWWNERWAG